MIVEEILKEQEEGLRLVEEELKKVFESSVAVIPAIGLHLLGSGGKRLRPLCLLLSSELSGYKGKERIVFASVIEAIHAASLLHDDVVDDAKVRRGKAASHSLWGNQVVILVGDFLYANALRLAVEQRNVTIIETIAKAAMKMTEGEILQLQKIADPTITEDEYLRIIALKTGSLMSAACRIGGVLGNLPKDNINALTEFGLKTGLVFQMSDDILDFQANEDTLGKRLGRDLHEGKITLPLIYLLKAADNEEKKLVIEEINAASGEQNSGAAQINIITLLELLRKYNCIGKSIDKAKEIVNEAKALLYIFPYSKEKEALLSMCEYALQRKK
ncbi:octaprenyl-diphosphate synthase [Candidatus Magnetoovum chiemensis]|nr:octaprenyl-diphosphate synthase [Candidatus Magnetoovum chiemensis]